MMSLPHNFPLSLYFKKHDVNSIRQLWESNTYLMSTLNKCNMMFARYILIWGHAFACLIKNKYYNFQNVIYTIHYVVKVRRWHHQLTFLNIYCSRNVLLNITNFIISYLPYFHPMLIKFSLFCLICFTLSIELN